MALNPGTRLGSYEILSPLGAGGMGEVYRAKHLKLERDVAIKVLPAELASDADRLHRFEREARAASALNHPSIVTIYDIDEQEGTSYIAMELVEGQTLRERLGEGALDTKEAVRLAIQIVEGLARAHAAGVVHRDVKPDNVMITTDGFVKILDFGLAKVTPTGGDLESQLTTLSRTTQQGLVLGTVPYMSPEQAGGRPVDHLSDQFSFGGVLYEMLCGQRPFQGESVATVLSAILRDAPPPPRSLRPKIPRALDEVIQRCLMKDPGERYSSTAQLGEALRRCEEGLTGAGKALTLGWKAVATAIGVLAVTVGAAAWFGLRDDVVRWMERDTFARITRLTEAGDLYEAFRLARMVQEKLPDDREVEEMVDRITIPVSIVTEPPGATVHLKGYSTPDAPWELLGETPLEGVRIPYALMRWQIRKEGFEPFEGAPFGPRSFAAFARGLPLEPEGTRPAGMVRVPGGPYSKVYYFPEVKLDDYWLDRYEVTNRQFKEFVDAGGYQREDLWTEPFLENARELPRNEAMDRLRDATGRPGPATWELGSYGEGQGNHPVGGVSWYEAAAYCRFAGKSLPTVYHWYAATGQDQLSDILLISNFGSDGPVPAGSRPGLGDFGTYDMAGNLKEWCWNATGAEHYILGGSWGEPTYMFSEPDAVLPFARDPNHGFRCARFEGPLDEALLASVTPSFHFAREEVVADDIFDAYRRIYAYDRTDLDSRTDSVEDGSPHWREETVSFKAAYGGERVIAHLFLPRNTPPPYQTVIWFPGDDAFYLHAGEGLASPYLFDFVPRSGRALVYPVYKGMYERYVPFSFAPNEWRDMMVMWSKDLGRTIDYLEERPDIDAEKLAYYGFSGGALYGPILTAIDGRFRASVLLAGGLLTDVPPEMSAASFAARSQVPTLMINGKNDFICPFEPSQQPLYRLLGAPEGQKRHARLEGGHIPSDRLAVIREVVAWLDRYLGPVEGD